MNTLDIIGWGVIYLILFYIYIFIGMCNTKAIFSLPQFPKMSKTTTKILKLLMLIFWPICIIIMFIIMIFIMIKDIITD